MSSDTVATYKKKNWISLIYPPLSELKPEKFKTNCPFRRGKTPSFIVSPDRQTWHYLAFVRGGGCYQILMKYENIGLRWQLKILAENWVELRISGNRDFNVTNNLYKIMEAAKDFKLSFAERDSGISRTRLKMNIKDLKSAFRRTVRYADAASDGIDLMVDIEKAGLALKTEQGTIGTDSARGWCFSIIVGKVVAFTGRILVGEPNVGKYVGCWFEQKSGFFTAFIRQRDIRGRASSAGWNESIYW